ncbi:hypothetical protein KC345_g1484 [Hortaea werneckii]|nr:hypothetical protein KC345_g1484 [Hortaea werneckii]
MVTEATSHCSYPPTAHIGLVHPLPPLRGLSSPSRHRYERPQWDVRSYTERLEGFRKSDAERDALVAELIKNHAALQLKYDEKCEDYNNEVESRRSWQSKFRSSEQALNQQKQVSGASNFALAVLDGDGAIFQDFLYSQGKDGGAEAAHIQRLRRSIVVYVILNLQGLGMKLASENIISNPNELAAFGRAFGAAQPHFNFIDVGAGKERADHKAASASSWATIGKGTTDKSFDVSSRPAPKKRYLLLNAYDERLDPDLLKADGRSWERFTDLTHTKGRNFCNNHHLGDKCESGEYCEYLHGPKLTNGELLVLKNKARSIYCANKSYCRDIDCYLGHHCKFGNTCSTSKCRFGDTHNVDLEPARRYYEDGSEEWLPQFLEKHTKG